MQINSRYVFLVNDHHISKRAEIQEPTCDSNGAGDKEVKTKGAADNGFANRNQFGWRLRGYLQ
jgi:hypothetical protein